MVLGNAQRRVVRPGRAVGSNFAWGWNHRAQVGFLPELKSRPDIGRRHNRSYRASFRLAPRGIRLGQDTKSEAASKAKPPAGGAKEREMGNALRSVYQRTVDEEVPDDLLDLLGKLT